MNQPIKTPDEIKKGLECCGKGDFCTSGACPYHEDCYVEHAVYNLEYDALAYIKQLEQELVAAKRERDAAVSELPHHCWNCKHHLDKPIEETDDNGRTIHRYCDADCCYPDEENSSWEWRGVCPENTEVQSDEC